METLARAANRGSVPTGYDIDNSLKLERANSEYLSRTPSSNGNQQIFTFSSWVKFSHINSGLSEWSTLFSAGDLTSTGPSFRIGHHTNNSLQVSFYTNSAYTGYYRTDALHRDTAAWYHFVCAIDTTQGTNTNRVKIYVNGEQASTDSVVSHIAQNYDSGVNTGIAHRIGHGVNMQTYASEYVAETHFVDGQALAPTEFGEFDDDSGIWIPKKVDVTYGTNGFYLDYADASDLGDDESGNGNDWTENNIAAADQATDTPTNNFCTLNQLALDGSVGSSGNITQGATKATATEFDVFVTFAPTFGVTSGKWYAEFEYEGSQADNLVGILDIDAVVAYNSRLGKVGQWSVGFYQANGKLYVTSDSGTTETANWGASAADGDIISVALDMDNHFVYFAKNGTWQNSGVPTSGSTGTGGVAFDSNKTVGIGCSSYDQGGDEGQIYANYGGYTAGTISSAATDANGYGTFEYAPPSGYYALCTKNLAEYG